MQRRVANEVLRRWWSYVKDMGVTGQMLLFLDLLSQRVPGFYGSESMHTFLKALPDQDALVSQKRFGMAFPFAPSDGRPAFLGDNDTREIYFMLAKPFVDPIFLETFCTLFPWHLPHPYDPDSILTAGIPLLFPSKGGDAALLRVLALQDLPEDNPRWSGEATMAFSTFMDSVLDAVWTLVFCLISSHLIPRVLEYKLKRVLVQDMTMRRRCFWSALLHGGERKRVAKYCN